MTNSVQADRSVNSWSVCFEFETLLIQIHFIGSNDLEVFQCLQVHVKENPVFYVQPAQNKLQTTDWLLCFAL